MAFAIVVTDPSKLTDPALLALILERLETMSANLDALTAKVTELQTQVVATKASADASQALTARAIATLENLAGQIAALQPDAAAIAALAASVGDSIATLQSEATEQADANAALTTELDKVETPPTP